MKMRLALVLVLLPLSAWAQKTDVIYLTNGASIDCVVTSITPQAIVYSEASGSQTITAGQWVLAIKQTGEFTLPGGAASWQEGTDPQVHRIILRNGNVVTARSLTLDGDALTYLPIETPQRQSLPAKDALLVFYRDGRHQLLAPAADVARGLAQLPKETQQPTASLVTASGDADGGEVLVLDDERKAHFEKMALVKANDFGKYLSIVSNKDEVEEDKLMAVSHAVMLFMSDSSKIQVSSLNQSESKQYTVPVYLDRLRMLPYDKVELLWVKAMMVSKFRKGMDGRYYGMIAAQQLFRGYLDNKIVYQDVTEKDIEVVLDQYVVFDEGKQQKKWDVLLSSVNVKQTREK